MVNAPAGLGTHRLPVPPPLPMPASMRETLGAPPPTPAPTPAPPQVVSEPKPAVGPVVKLAPAPEPKADPAKVAESKTAPAAATRPSPAPAAATKPAPPAAPAPKPVPAVVVQPKPTPVVAPKPTPTPALRPVAVVKPAPEAQASRSPVATLERPAPQQIASVVLTKAPVVEPEDELDERPRLATRVASLPRVLLDTVAWGGFAAVVALIVIALSDVGMGRAALWAVGLSGIVVLAVAVMAVTGTHLDELSHAGRATEGPD